MLGQKCRLPSDVLAKQAFVNRLTRFLLLDRQFQCSMFRTRLDIYAIAKKYCIETYVEHYCTSSFRHNINGNICLSGLYMTLRKVIHSKASNKVNRERP